MSDGYGAFVHFTAAEMADRIAVVVADWLRAEADKRCESADRPNGYTAFWEADALKDLADALTQPSTEEKR